MGTPRGGRREGSRQRWLLETRGLAGWRLRTGHSRHRTERSSRGRDEQAAPTKVVITRERLGDTRHANASYHQSRHEDRAHQRGAKPIRPNQPAFVPRDRRWRRGRAQAIERTIEATLVIGVWAKDVRVGVSQELEGWWERVARPRRRDDCEWPAIRDSGDVEMSASRIVVGDLLGRADGARGRRRGHTCESSNRGSLGVQPAAVRRGSPHEQQGRRSDASGRTLLRNR